MEKNVVIKLVEAILSKEPPPTSTEIEGNTLAEKIKHLVAAIQWIDQQESEKNTGDTES